MENSQYHIAAMEIEPEESAIKLEESTCGPLRILYFK